MDSRRLQTLKGLTTLLSSITLENGYQHDLTGKVFRGRNRFGDGEPLPRLSILEAPHPEESDSPEISNLTREKWQLFLQGWVQEDLANPTDPAHNLMADVKKCLSQLRGRYSASAYPELQLQMVDLNIGGGTCRPPDESYSEAYFVLVIEFTFVEDTNDPYT